jgi:hypothetical protein
MNKSEILWKKISFLLSIESKMIIFTSFFSFCDLHSSNVFWQKRTSVSKRFFLSFVRTSDQLCLQFLSCWHSSLLSPIAERHLSEISCCCLVNSLNKQIKHFIIYQSVIVSFSGETTFKTFLLLGSFPKAHVLSIFYL